MEIEIKNNDYDTLLRFALESFRELVSQLSKALFSSGTNENEFYL